MIPFNVPYLVGRETELIADAISRRHFSGDGHYTRRANELIEQITTSPTALLTTSCTHALELSALLLDIRAGDEVILPSFTFVSTVNAFVLRGATPVFVDVRADTRNIDERQIERAITSRTRAIVVVHYGGVACEMDEIMALAAAHGIAVVEDAAHGLGGTYRGRALGSIGALATLSFHETKNVQCGEGGALLVNDPALAARAEILREKGTNRSRFLRGQVDKYSWVDVGSSYLPAELLAAFLTAQLEAFDSIQEQRMAIWNRYSEALKGWAAEQGAELAAELSDRQHPAHLFAIVHRDLATRQRFIAHMADGGVKTSFHYVPLHSSPAGRRVAVERSLPVTDAVANGLVRLPLYPDLTAAEVDQVVNQAQTFEA
jgi:dTDP-4-amino-4,6-dideoxygalactose transaminase